MPTKCVAIRVELRRMIRSREEIKWEERRLREGEGESKVSAAKTNQRRPEFGVNLSPRKRLISQTCFLRWKKSAEASVLYRVFRDWEPFSTRCSKTRHLFRLMDLISLSGNTHSNRSIKAPLEYVRAVETRNRIWKQRALNFQSFALLRNTVNWSNFLDREVWCCSGWLTIFIRLLKHSIDQI